MDLSRPRRGLILLEIAWLKPTPTLDLGTLRYAGNAMIHLPSSILHFNPKKCNNSQGPAKSTKFSIRVASKYVGESLRRSTRISERSGGLGQPGGPSAIDVSLPRFTNPNAHLLSFSSRALHNKKRFFLSMVGNT